MRRRPEARAQDVGRLVRDLLEVLLEHYAGLQVLVAPLLALPVVGAPQPQRRKGACLGLRGRGVLDQQDDVEPIKLGQIKPDPTATDALTEADLPTDPAPWAVAADLSALVAAWVA